MARGWESRQVEDQQAEALRRREGRPRRALTPEEQVRRDRHDTLRLAAARTRDAITAVRAGVHRETLQMQLDAIQGEIATLGLPDEDDR